MANIRIKQTHTLPMAGARQRVDEIFETYKQRFNASSQWRGNTLHLTGGSFEAQAVVEPSFVDVDVKLNFTAGLFRSSIESGLKEELEKRFKDRDTKST